ncbi:MAG: 3'(2'),5'-bisphosphate nucleotidase CysQ [Hyphomicrobiales bacterium]|nr:3'(2'),5'-bisphosphate nucleotidase CysQ [Hyphomicrobiales bacterium]
MSAQSRTDTDVRNLAVAAVAAGRAVIAAEADGIKSRTKPDGTPVTNADLAAESILIDHLRRDFPDIRIVSEESHPTADATEIDRQFLLVDPIDGTRELLSGRDSYTVNAALIEEGRAVVGAVYAPARGMLFIGTLPDRAFALEVSAETEEPIDFDAARPISVSPAEAGLRALVSRSHLDPATIAFLERIGSSGSIKIGSSIKFCMIACGEGDIYPRLGTTMEWDTAAGQVVLEAAGGRVRTLDGTTLRYGKVERGFRNPGFVACGDLPPLLANLNDRSSG